MDEKAIAKGQTYLTLVVDLQRATVEHLADERTQASLAGYFEGLTGAQTASIAAVAMDMWPAYIQATRAHVPGAAEKSSLIAITSWPTWGRPSIRSVNRSIARCTSRAMRR